MVNIWNILNCAKKIYSVKIICSTHQRKCSSTILGNFWKSNFWRNIHRRGPDKNGENLNYLKLCKEIIFMQNYLFHSSKEVFLHNFRQFLENWIFEQKWWKFVLSQFVLRKYFLAKLFVPLIKGSVSPQFYAIFGKLNFWRNIDRPRPYKVVKIWTILNCAKKFFLAKLFVLLIKGRVSPQFKVIFWKLNFWRNIDRRWPYKNGENLYYLNLCKENIFGQNYLWHSTKEVFLHNFTQFLENWIFEGISTGASLIKWWKFVLSQFVLRKYFWQNYLFHSTKEVILHNFRQFLENWIFEEMSTGADLTKMVKIWTILNCAKKLFFGKIICSTHQRKSFPTI